jgi:predicted amidohydrolase YtcJ
MSAPQLAILNARIRTLDPDGPFATAVACAGGRITDVGDDRTIRALANSGTRVIDADGRSLVPGLVEGHAHPILGTSSPAASASTAACRSSP